MELNKSRLCLDCEWVDEYQTCPKCGSKVTYPLGNFLADSKKLLILKLFQKGEKDENSTGNELQDKTNIR